MGKFCFAGREKTKPNKAKQSQYVGLWPEILL